MCKRTAGVILVFKLAVILLLRLQNCQNMLVKNRINMNSIHCHCSFKNNGPAVPGLKLSVTFHNLPSLIRFNNNHTLNNV